MSPVTFYLYKHVIIHCFNATYQHDSRPIRFFRNITHELYVSLNAWWYEAGCTKILAWLVSYLIIEHSHHVGPTGMAVNNIAQCKLVLQPQLQFRATTYSLIGISWRITQQLLHVARVRITWLFPLGNKSRSLSRRDFLSVKCKRIFKLLCSIALEQLHLLD